MSFDNCTELDRWTELRDFAAELDKSGARVRFTYFVTGLNFIADANRNIYEGPRHKRGASTLDFGGTKDDVARASRSPTRPIARATRSLRTRSAIGTAVPGRRRNGRGNLIRSMT